MRAIILVAGRGSRLPKKLSKIPKSLIKINNKTLLERQIKIFSSFNIKNISIVTGYKKNLFNNFKLKKFHNQNWKTTNMVHSLKKAKTWLENYDCIVTYGDIIYTSKAIRNLMHSKSKISVLFDKNWKSLWKKRFKNPLSDAETFMYDNKKNLQEIGLKTKNYKNIQGQFMGIIKFKPSGWKKFDKNLQKYFKKNHKIFTTDVLNSLIKNEKFKIKAINYDDKWSEIDNKNDIKTTHKIFK